MTISATRSIKDNWLDAASDGVVTNAEVYEIYAAARETGISTQDLLSAAAAVNAANDAVRAASRLERSFEAQARACEANAERLSSEGLRRPAADALAAGEVARRAQRSAEHALFRAQDAVPQARKLERLIRDQADAQGFLDRLYADFADL